MGGGNKKKYRIIDFKRQNATPATVLAIEYDPNRNPYIALIQHEDGTLTLGQVDAVSEKYNQDVAVEVKESQNMTEADGTYTLAGNAEQPDAYMLMGRLGSHNKISFTVTTSNKWDKFGISMVRGSDSKKYYTMVVNPEDENNRKVNFEEQGVEGKGFIAGIDCFVFARPADNVYNVTIYTDNSSSECHRCGWYSCKHH